MELMFNIPFDIQLEVDGEPVGECLWWHAHMHAQMYMCTHAQTARQVENTSESRKGELQDVLPKQLLRLVQKKLNITKQTCISKSKEC